MARKRSKGLACAISLVFILVLGTLLNSVKAEESLAPSQEQESYTDTSENINIDDTTPKLELPRAHIQLVCHDDIRETFDPSQTINDFYKQQIMGADLLQVEVKSDMKSSAMDDIPPDRWFYGTCNVTSPQVLMTMELDGWAYWNVTNRPPPNRRVFMEDMLEQATPRAIEKYFEKTVCSDIMYIRVYVEDWFLKKSPEPSVKEDPFFDHSLYLLCAADGWKDGEGPDGPFLLFGFMVGILMVCMLVTELQQFQVSPLRSRNDRRSERSSSSSRRRTRDTGRGDYAATPSEVEMV